MDVLSAKLKEGGKMEEIVDSLGGRLEKSSEEEMKDHLCRCGYSREELEDCSEEELRMMCKSHEEDEMENLEEKKKWIQDIKMKKGALHRQLGVPSRRKIPSGLLNKVSNANIGTKVRGHTVTPLLKKRAVLARTLRKY